MQRTQTIVDLEERRIALDSRRSFIVQAPAGSGKTELLIKRYLALLAVVERPEEILAVTFTRKAAGEMERRIIDALARAGQNMRPEKPHEIETHELALHALSRNARLGWDITKNPARLRVLTIDSVSSMFARRMPILSAIGGSASPMEDPSELYLEAARRAVALAESEGVSGEVARSALRHFDNSATRLAQRLVNMLEKRDQWLRHAITAQDSEFRERVEGALARMIEDTLTKVAVLLSPYMGRVLKFGRFAAKNLFDENSASPVTKLKDLDEPPGTRVQEIDKWRGVAELLLTQNGTFRKPAGVNKTLGFPSEKKGPIADIKDGFKELLEELASIEGIEDALTEIRFLPKPRYSEDEWQILSDLLHLLPIADNELSGLFRALGKVDFQGVTFAALKSLGTDEAPTDLMLSLDVRLRHILVDEFQDTSITHLELIKALVRGWEEGDGRTLFLVGDPMQSIYLFRDAEVGIFLDARIKKAIANVKLEPLALKCNFRSDPKIVDWVNSVVGRGFPKNEDTLTSAVGYSGFFAGRPDDGTERGARITLYGPDRSGEEAADVCRAVKEITGRFPDETVAVLAMYRSHLAEIIEAFEREGVDFRTKDIDPLDKSQVVLDLFSLLKSLMHSHDRVAWLSVLRAPWCGLDLADLLALCRGDDSSAVWDLINDHGRIERVSPEGRALLERARPALKTALSLYNRVSTRPLLEGLWISLGGPATLSGPDDMADACAFFDMISEMEIAGEPLAVERIERGLEKLYASHMGATKTPVEVMTMHGAKGLEFDHVILPGIGNKPRPDEKEMAIFLECGGDLYVAPVEGAFDEGGSSGIYDYLRSIKGRRAENERVRLLYVAATRAKKTLNIFGQVRDGLRPVGASLLAVIQDSLTDDMLSVPRSNANEAGETAAITIPARKRLKIGWMPPEPSLAPVGLLAGRMEEAVLKDARPVFDWADEAIRHLGTVAHSYFVNMVKDGVENWDLSRIRAEKGRMESMLFAHGLNRAEAKAVAEECVKVLESAVNSKLGQWVLSTHALGETEYRVTGVIDDDFKHMVIDRTFVDADNTRWVIDYKTGSHTGGDLDAFLRDEKERYAAQIGAYKRLVEELDKERKIRCALYYPALDKLVEY